MADLIAARAGLPGCRVVQRHTAITIRHFPGDTSALDAARQSGLTWPHAPGMLTGADPWLAWRSPQETIGLGLQPAALRALLDVLAPGRSESALAADLSEALGVLELHGPRLDEWLAHLVDASAVPRETGRVTRARLAESSVMLLWLQPQRLWVVMDRPIRSYVENWLAYAHEGAFAASA